MSIIVSSRQVFPFDMIARLAHRQAGEAMLLEAYKQRAKILAELQRERPDLDVDRASVMVEIAVQYLVPEDED
jgi:hypothetical protein